MAMLAILVLPLMYLGWTAVAVVLPAGGRVDGQCRPARLHRGALCLHLGDRQQRLGLRAASPATPSSTTSPLGIAMFVGRFFMIVPAMAIAGSLAAKKIGPAVGRHVPDHRRPVRRPRRRRDPDHRRPDLLPGAGARADRRAPRDERQHPVLIDLIFGVTSMETMKLQKKVTASTMLDPEDPRAGDRLGLRQARPAADDQEPGDVRGRGRGRADHRHLPARPRHRRRESRLHVPDHPLALVHGAVRQFRRSRRRRPRQGAGGIAAARPAPRARPSC